MLKRIDIEEREASTLSAYACLSKNSKGRAKEEEKCDIRTIFQHDRDRIIHSKAFRRLKHKTQVFNSRRGSLSDQVNPYPGGSPDCPDYRQGFGFK